MNQDRRRFPRNICRLPVRLYPKQEARVIETLTKDLSIGGLRCISRQAKPSGMPLSVELMLEPGERPLTLRGNVAWSHPIEESDQFDVGISFSLLPEITRARLSTYITRLASLTPLPAEVTS